MIISGGPRCNWRFFSKHLVRTDENERVQVTEIRGLAGDTPLEALREMNALASGTRVKHFFYHADINPREDERLSPEQWEEAVDRLEKNLGLEGQSRFVVEHEKQGRVHRHVIWSRIDPETMTAVSDSHNFAKHAATARELEREFDLRPVRGVLERADGPRPERRFENWETFRGHKSGIDPQEVKAEVTALWQKTDSGKAFQTALAQHGYVLAQGDRRDFCIIDAQGHEHSLARRLSGAKAADIRARMSDIERDDLPRVMDGRTERRADKKRVLEAVELGADKRGIERVINAGRAAELMGLPAEDEASDAQRRAVYERTLSKQRESSRESERQSDGPGLDYTRNQRASELER